MTRLQHREPLDFARDRLRASSASTKSRDRRQAHPLAVLPLSLILFLAASTSFAQNGEALPPPPPPVDASGYTSLPPPPPPPVGVAPTPATAPSAEPEPAKERKTGFSFKMSLAGSYRILYGIHFGGGDLALALGGQTKGAAFYANLQLFLGSTAFGLTTSDLQIAFAAEGRIGDRFRVGGGAGFSLLMIRRITREDTIFDFTVGPQLHSTFDLVQWDDAALFLQLKLGFEWLVMANDGNAGIPLMGAAMLGIGFRY